MAAIPDPRKRAGIQARARSTGQPAFTAIALALSSEALHARVKERGAAKDRKKENVASQS
jgi:hypothetical protein